MKPALKGNALLLLSAALVLTGCAVGPRYSRPQASSPPSFKELPPGWKEAQPGDQTLRGKWWEIFQDSQLNLLEDKVNVSNQTLKAAFDQFLQARALVRFHRADLYPAVTAGAAASRNRLSTNRGQTTALARTNFTDVQLPTVNASYEPDLFGRIRLNIEASRARAQASAGDLESVSLSLHADLAVDYFQLRTLDAEEQLLNSTVSAYEKALELTQNRYKGGVSSAVDVAQAQTQLENTRAQAVDVQVARTQFEHAIATLTGEPASSFSIPFAPWDAPPPLIPVGVPSDLLERRPDIAASERRIAAANAQLGIARAAYFPVLSLSASGGFESSTITNLISGPAGFYSLGANAIVTAFDVGRRRSVTEQSKAAYDQSVANYRQTILTAFQEVEDNLAALRILDQEATTQKAAVDAAEKSLGLSVNRYKGGVTTYLEVTTAQGIALNDERLAVEILARRMSASVLLIQALGGGWNASQLPSGNPDSLPRTTGQ